MKSALRASAAIATLVAGSSVFAADLPARSPAPAPSFVSPTPVYNWSGLYVGLHAGYVGESVAFRVIEAGTPSATANPTGFVGGGLMGFNYQMGQAVVGLENDIGFTTLSGRANAGGLGGFAHSNRFKEDWNGHLRARLGFAAGNFMPFVAAGYSYGSEKLTVTNGAASASASKTLGGWNIGVGVDYAFGNNLVARVEYIYDQYNRMTFTPNGGFNNRATSRPDQSTIRAALIYTFGGGVASPVVAKY